MTKDNLNNRNGKFYKSKGDDDMLAVARSSNRINFIKEDKTKEFLEFLKAKKSENEEFISRCKNNSTHINK
ncbi:hypothetical protein [Bacillus sp. ISL-57]|uniref:hypothetical protein n=1 Tax=Bacillus sp. ISL-57 TaxID=2819135 RepID=UPI001BE822FC|nr:hypothetical protein [Bacillus sp. ISL-57]MBT2716970.1 hypothetical protein [Bacillus sp. ISL-57]